MEKTYWTGSTYYDHLIPEMKYAVKSDNRDEVMRVYGMAQMAHNVGYISFDQYWKFNEVLIRCFINGGADHQQKALKQIEETEW